MYGQLVLWKAICIVGQSFGRLYVWLISPLEGYMYCRLVLWKALCIVSPLEGDMYSWLVNGLVAKYHLHKECCTALISLSKHRNQ